MSKDRARPFSRKHRKYWIPVTGGMILIGLIDVSLGLCSYTPPSDVHERILLDVPYARGSGPAAAPLVAADCAAAVTAQIAADLPGATIVACTPTQATVARGGHTIALELDGTQIRAIAETLTLPEIPTAVIRAFAVAYPRTIPAGAVKRTRRGSPPVFELAFPAGAGHALAVLRGDGSVVELR